MLAFSWTPLKQDLWHCMIITLLRVYIVILSLMALTLFQGHRFVRNVDCILFCILVFCSLNIVWLLHTLKKNMHNRICVTLGVFKGDN